MCTKSYCILMGTLVSMTLGGPTILFLISKRQATSTCLSVESCD